MFSKLLKSVQAFFADDEETPNKKANTDNVRVEQDGNQATLYAKLGESDGMRLGKAASLKAKFESLLDGQAPQQHLLAAANNLMLGGFYPEAIVAFKALGERCPDLLDGMHNNTGACCYLMGQYAESVRHYLLAREAGFDARMTEENIFKSAAKATKMGDANAIDWYLEAYPNSNAAKIQERIRKFRE
jgi:tetratricopeptide (TPR) repeat protein